MRIWHRVLLTGLLLLSLAAAYLFWPQGLWPFIPQIDTDAGVLYDVEILRDTYGVPHIFGITDADVAYGLAYAHAEDDFLTIQQALLAARGKLATVYGRDAAPNDYMVQLFRIWDVIDADYETKLQPDTREMLAGYAAGLNLYAVRHPRDVLAPDLFPLTGPDIVAGFMHKTPLFYGVDGVLTELFAEERQRPVSVKDQVTSPTDRAAIAHIPDNSSSWLADFRAPALPPAALAPTTRFGSNTLAVSPARSAGGETFLAINSHQPWTGPIAWYEAHLHSEAGWDVVGGLFPGAPAVLLGHNQHLGWAFTVNDPDLVDVFVLDINPENPNEYRFDGEWLTLEVREAPITVQLMGRFRWTVTEEVLWSVYGPTVRRPHGTYALRFSGYGEVGLVEQWYRMNKATQFDEWLTAMREGPLPMFSAGYADAAGNIYYLYNGLLPLRTPNYDWTHYLPGDTSETLWTEYLPFDELPQVLNPPSGFIQNGNSTPFQTTIGTGNPDPLAYSSTLGIELEMTNRALRSLELLDGDEAITAAEFATFKFDLGFSEQSDVATYVNALRQAAAPDDADLQTALDLLATWDLQTNPDSKAATIGLLMLYFLEAQDDVDITSWRLVGTEVPETLLLEAVAEVAAHLRTHYGRIDVPWGDVNRLRRGDVDLPLGGGPDIMHAIYGEFDEDGRLRGVAGDAYILLVTWDSAGRVSSHSVHQFGSATLNESSHHYADQAPFFARRELTPVWFTEADIRANLTHAYRPGGEGR